MRTRTQLTIFTLAVFAGSIFALPAVADGRGRSVGKAARALGQISRSDRGGRGGSSFPILEAIGRANGGGRGGSPFPLLEALSRASNGNGGRNDSFPILRELQRQNGGNHNGGRNNKHYGGSPADLLYGLYQLSEGGYSNGYGRDGAYPYYDSYYRHKSDEEYSDSIRDAAIANAVGNVVTAIVQTQGVRTQVPVYAQPAPVYAQPAPVYAQPAPVYAPPAQTYVQPNPMGRYETRREQVGGGYYEREQIWVPEATDPRTGHIIEGHNETVRRWVPEVYQESRVWVAP